MDAQKVDMFLMTNSSKLPASHIPIIRDRLLDMDESKLIYLQTCDFNEKEEPGTVAEYINVLIPATCGKKK